MSFRATPRAALLSALLVLIATVAWQGVFAEDVAHAVSGIVKSVNKSTKTVVLKTADGTEQTFKYTGKTVVQGSKDAAKGTAQGSTDAYLGAKKGTKVTIEYTEKGAEKTATGIKDAVD